MISEQQIQSSIIDELRAFIGGPGSLRWPSHELLPALASATGRLCALTLRNTQQMWWAPWWRCSRSSRRFAVRSA